MFVHIYVLYGVASAVLLSQEINKKKTRKHMTMYSIYIILPNLVN